MGRWLACGFLLLALAGPMGWVQAQPLTLDVVPGFDGVCPEGGCYPVTVLIQGVRADAPPAVAEVQVVATSWGGGARARKRVTLSGGTVSQAVSFLLCSPGEPDEVRAWLSVGGRVLVASKPASAVTAQRYPLLVGLGTDASAVAALPPRKLGVVNVDGVLLPEESAPRHGFSASPFLGAEQRWVFVGRTRNSLPPENALAYRGVAAVSLDDRAWDTLTERQQRALQGYVWAGGLLVVHGVDLNRLQSLAPSGLLPVEPLGLAQAPASALAGWIPSLTGATGQVAVVRSRPLGDAQTLLRYGDLPLVVAARRGLGQVIFLAFDPSQPPLSREQAAHALWKRLLQQQVGGFSAPPVMFPQGGRFSWGAPGPGTRGSYSQMVQTMIEAVAAKPVPLRWLLTYLGVYILALIPLNYLVLRRLDRLHLSWFTLPLLAVLTSVAGYVLAARVQTSAPQMRQLTAVYVASGSPQATVESDWVLYSAHSQHYRLRAQVEGVLFESSPSELQARRVEEIPQEEPADLREVPIPLWSARGFHLSGRTLLPGTVSLSAVPLGNTLRLTVRNNAPYTLKKLHLVAPPGVVALQASCSPGGRAEVDVPNDASWSTPTTPTLPSGFSPPSSWREAAQRGWLGLVWARLSDGNGSSSAAGRDKHRTPTELLWKRGVLVAEVEGFPPVVEVTPTTLSTEQVTVLAVPFEVGGDTP